MQKAARWPLRAGQMGTMQEGQRALPQARLAAASGRLWRRLQLQLGAACKQDIRISSQRDHSYWCAAFYMRKAKGVCSKVSLQRV